MQPVKYRFVRIISRRSEQLAEQPVSLEPHPQRAPETTKPDQASTRSARVTRATAIRGVIALIGFIAVLVAAYYVPLPTISTMRAWSESLGPWFPTVFFLAYTLIATSPIPRTPFTFAAGLLFQPLVAFTGVTIAATVAAVVAFCLARKLGRNRVQKYLTHPAIGSVELRLKARGWLAVGSLRLIAVCPFSLVNYLSGLSSVRLGAFAAATVIGMTPGNASLIFLGDALAGAKNPVSLIFSAALFALGVIGLIVDSRLPIKATKSSN